MILIFNKGFLEKKCLTKAKIFFSIFLIFFLSNIFFVDSFGVQQVLNNGYNSKKVENINSNNLSKKLLDEHIKIGNNLVDYSDGNYSDLQLIKKLKDLISLNLVQKLDETNDKKTFLDNYLNDVSKILKISTKEIEKLEMQISKYDNQMQICISQKEKSDSDFFYSIDQNNDVQMQTAVSKSVENSKCISENKVEMNAKKAILQQISYYTQLLQKKYDYVLSKKELIIKYFELMKDSILEELFWTRDVLLKNYEK